MTDPYHVSIITIGLDETSIRRVRDLMKQQTYDDLEVVGSTKDGIPAAWNHALTNASGELYVFTETDAAPIRDDWLERIVADFNLPERRVVHYGEVGRPGHGYDLSNLAVPAAVVDEFCFDESYPIVEDTELFTRMDMAGVKFEKRYDNPVYHHPAPDRQNERAFQRGYYQARCRLRHGQIGPSNETRHIPGNLDDKTAISESASLPEIIIDQITSPLQSVKSELAFLAGGAKATVDHIRGQL